MAYFQPPAILQSPVAAEATQAHIIMVLRVDRRLQHEACSTLPQTNPTDPFTVGSTRDMIWTTGKAASQRHCNRFMMMCSNRYEYVVVWLLTASID